MFFRIENNDLYSLAKRVKQKLYDSFLILLSLALTLVVSYTIAGIWPMPNLGPQFWISKHLTLQAFEDPSAHYLYSSYLQPYLFNLIGGESLSGYFIFSLIASIMSTVILSSWFISYHGFRVSILEGKVIILACFTSLNIVYYWVGMDSLTILLMTLTLVRLKHYDSLIYAFLLGTQHFEQAFIAFTISVLLITLHSGQAKQLLSTKSNSSSDIKIAIHVIYVLISIVAGKLFLLWHFSSLDLLLEGDRGSYFQNNYASFIKQTLDNYAAIIWSIFGGAWVVLFYNKKAYGIVVLVFILSFLVGDKTRVIAICAFPSIFFLIICDKKFWRDLTSFQVMIGVIVSICAPYVIVWGEVRMAGMTTYLPILLDHLNDIESLDLMLPYK